MLDRERLVSRPCLQIVRADQASVELLFTMTLSRNRA